MQRIRVGMRGMRWECEECDGNAGAGNQRGNAGNLGGNTKDMENQSGGAGSQGGNKIIENKHICKNLISHI